MNKVVHIYDLSTDTIKFCLYIISVILIINVTDRKMNGVSKFEFSPSGDNCTGEKEKNIYI